MDRRLKWTVSFWLLLVLGVGLLIWGAWRSFTPSACGSPNNAYNQNLYNQAEKGYLAVLTAQPGSPCAVRGLRAVEEQRCRLAKGLSESEAKPVLDSEVKDLGALCQKEGHDLSVRSLSVDLNWLPDKLAWVLLVLGAALLVRQTRLWIIRKRPGSVSVSDFENATGSDKVQVKSFTARMRERLGTAGALPPAPVPGGSLEQGVVEAVAASPLGEAKWIAKALQLVAQMLWATNGHQVTGTLRKGTYAPLYGLTVQLSDTGSGSTERVASFWSDSHESAVRDAAFYVYQQVTSHPDVLDATPVWRRWTATNGAGVSHFHGGRWEEDLGHAEKAIKQYRAAAVVEPLNAVVRLRLGALLESQDQRLDALEQYLNISIHWPDLLLPSYRLAAMYSAHRRLVGMWRRGSTAKISELTDLINQAEKAPLTPKDLDRYFLERAIARCDQLSYADGPKGEDLNARRFKHAARVGACVARTKLAIYREYRREVSSDAMRAEYKQQCEIADFVLGRRPDWTARYNRACLSSWGARVDSAKSEFAALEAIKWLRMVTSDPDSRLDLNWIRKDPDMDPIRRTKAFSAWAGVLDS